MSKFVSPFILFAGCAPHTGGVAPSTLESDHLRVARTEIVEFEGAARSELASELFAPGYQLHFPGFPPMDVAGHEQVLAAFHTAFPDLVITVLEQVAEGDCVANHIHLRGTHQGPFQGIPATGRTVDITGNNLMRFEGGRIAELWGFLDSVSMLEQLGVAPAGPPRDVPPAPSGAPSTPEGARAVVTEFIQGFNDKNVDQLSAAFDSAYVLDFPGGPRGRGLDGIRAATTDFIRAFPDLRFSVDDLISDGQGVAWRWTMTGTHDGPLGPFPASHKQVTLTGLSMLHVRDGRIVDDRVRADMVGLLGQIGALPPQP
jgi:steroid delta-isomerase-like uncharacterized protein